jgi:AcrR family transcriptional regulator
VTANLVGMAAESTPVRLRVPAAERREQTVAIALRHFAEGGYHGTSTEAIAAEVGVSQPYLFRLFRTKRELFLGCCAACNGRIREAFRAAAAAVPQDQRLKAMGDAYIDLLEDRHLLRFQLQMYAACSDEVIRAEVRRGYKELVDEVRELSGADEERLWNFFSVGMLLNVVATIGLDEIAGEDPWAAAWSDPKSALHEPPC